VSVELEKAVRGISEMTAVTGRSCGDCSLCCKLMTIDELDKPANQWCKHCKPGRGGCTIYEARPNVCRGFACGWLVSDAYSDEWKPTRSKMVVHYTGAKDGMSMRHFEIYVDPAEPARWRQAPYYDDIKAFASQGLTDTPGFATEVIVGKHKWAILPDRDVLVSDYSFYSVLRMDCQYDVMLFFDKETATHVEREINHAAREQTSVATRKTVELVNRLIKENKMRVNTGVPR
jgi:hypothetical protein